MADPFGTGYGFWDLGLTHVAGPLELDLGYFHTADRAVRLFGGQFRGRPGLGHAALAVLSPHR